MPITLLTTLHGVTPPTHNFETVSALMGMHGKWDARTASIPGGVDFVARNYGMVTTGTSCSGMVNLTHTIEDAVVALLREVKPRLLLVPRGHSHAHHVERGGSGARRGPGLLARHVGDARASVVDGVHRAAAPLEAADQRAQAGVASRRLVGRRR